MATSNLTGPQAARWIGELRGNLAKHGRRRKMTPEIRLNFLSEQYSQLYLLHSAIEGRVRFVGTPPIGETQDG